MKKICFLLLSFVFLGLICSAQFLQLAEGPAFEQPESGFAKILQMKSGNTMFLNVNFKTGILVHVYEQSMKARTIKEIKPGYGLKIQGTIYNIFEINNDAVIFIGKSLDRAQAIYRLIIDGKTGELKEETLLATQYYPELENEKVKNSNNSNSSIWVRKDVVNDQYVLALVNPYISDTGHQIQLYIYSQNHEEMLRSDYNGNEDNPLDLKPAELVLYQGEKIMFLMSTVELKQDGNNANDLKFAELDKQTNKFVFRDLPDQTDMLPIRSIARYDEMTKRVYFLTYAKLKSDAERTSTNMLQIDVVEKKVTSSVTVKPGDKVTARYAEIYGKKSQFNPIPQQLLISDNGEYRILFEEINSVKSKDSVKSTIRTACVVSYDIDGVIQTSYVFPINQPAYQGALSAFYHYDRQRTGQSLYKGNEYLSGQLIADKFTSFYLTNESVTGNKIALQDATYYALQGLTANPDKQFVAGKASKLTDPDLWIPSLSDYDALNNLLIVVKPEKLAGKPGYKLLWLQP